MKSRFGILTCGWSLALITVATTSATSTDVGLKLIRQNVPIGTGASTTTTSPNTPVISNSASFSNAPGSSSINVPASSAAVTQSASQSPSETTTASDSVFSSTNPQTSRQDSSINTVGSTSVVVESTTGSKAETGQTEPTSTGQPRSKSVSSKTTQIVTTITTVSGTSTHTSVFTTSGLVPVSTSSVLSTSNPSLDAGDNGSSKSGLDSSQKRIIIGVVVGIGGAILLGGIAVVAWRIWGRKRNPADEGTDLMDSQIGSSGREKRSSVSGQSPFRSTLEQYHNAGVPVNTASNF